MIKVFSFAFSQFSEIYDKLEKSSYAESSAPFFPRDYNFISSSVLLKPLTPTSRGRSGQRAHARAFNS